MKRSSTNSLLKICILLSVLNKELFKSALKWILLTDNKLTVFLQLHYQSEMQ
jgi:hypothetical protein